jgi:hypothetical protein
MSNEAGMSPLALPAQSVAEAAPLGIETVAFLLFLAVQRSSHMTLPDSFLNAS